MPLINRDNSPSEQTDWDMFISQSAVAAGTTLVVYGPMPYPYTLQSFAATAVGMSGAPQLAFSILRPLTPGGKTIIPIGISNLVLANGFSGVVPGYSGLAPNGSTLLSGQAGDIFLAGLSGANTAVTQLVINVVWKKTQDIVSYNGVPT